MHGEEQELKHKTMAVPACYVPVFLKNKCNNARKAVWFTKATVIGAISAFVDSIDSHIILQMTYEPKIHRPIVNRADHVLLWFDFDCERQSKDGTAKFI